MAILATVAVVGIVLLGALAVGLREPQNDLIAAKRLMVDGRRALSFGNVDDARERFRKAGEHFALAEDEASSGIAGMVGRVPIVGRNVDVARDLAAAGGRLADAGLTVAKAISDLPDGLGSLAPSGGALPVDSINKLAEPVEQAAADAQAALEIVQASPSSLLLGPAATGRSDAEELTTEAARILQAGRDLLAALPHFVGADGTRRYLFVAENPAELRGTGGLWGAYSIATMRNGDLTFGDFTPIQRLTDLPKDSVPPPNPDYERNYDQYGGASFWLNMNMTPDFPSAARAALSTYEATEHVQLDGVIAADPFALQALMEITGPTTIPGYDLKLDADSVVQFTTYTAYHARFFGRHSELRKQVLGIVAKDVFERFLATDRRQIGRLRALARAAVDGHVQVYSTDPQMQSGLALARADGSLSAPSGDLLDVNVNSGSGTKIDYFATRKIGYDVTLGGEGAAHAKTTITLGNEAPAEGEPKYIIGPNLKRAEAGDQIDILTSFCVQDCDLVRADRDGKQIKLRVGKELGYVWFQDYLTVGSGQTAVVSIQTDLKHVWEGNSSGGTYTLSFINQTMIRPASLHIVIHPPAGTHVTSTSEGMTVDDGAAVWDGVPGPRLELEVRFSAPIPLRWWRNLTRPIS